MMMMMMMNLKLLEVKKKKKEAKKKAKEEKRLKAVESGQIPSKAALKQTKKVKRLAKKAPTTMTKTKAKKPAAKAK